MTTKKESKNPVGFGVDTFVHEHFKVHFQKDRTIHRNVHTDCLQTVESGTRVHENAYDCESTSCFFIFKISHSYLLQ